MSDRARRLLWLAPAAALALGAASVVLLAAVPDARLPRAYRLDAVDALFALVFAVYAIFGVIIARRFPRNVVGWLFVGAGVMLPLTGALWAYALYSLNGTTEGLPGEAAAAWVAAWSSEPLLVVLVLLLLVFPDGRFLSRAWRRVGWAAVGTAVLGAVALALRPGTLVNLEQLRPEARLDNPLGVDAAPGALDAIASMASVVTSLLFVVAAISLAVRYRRAAQDQREQIKWLAVAGVVAMTMVLVLIALDAFADTDRGALEVASSVVALVAVVIVPVGVGLAVLRHRLYEVDVVINRTLVYGALTAALVGCYVGLVLVLQVALSPVAERSDLAVAGSTLAVAALFGPLRRRIQGWVDRRFYRARYDARRTLDAFSVGVRDEVELEVLSGRLRAVVAETMQPAHVSLWLRDRNGDEVAGSRGRNAAGTPAA